MTIENLGNNDNIDLENDDINLDDVLDDGKNNWRFMKLQSQKLSDSYLRIWKKEFAKFEINTFLNLSVNMKHCGTYLDFKLNENNEQKLIASNFCRARLCPMCSWRRSKKVFGQVSKIIKEINKDNNFEYIFLTLTCKNVTGDKLGEQLSIFTKAFNQMTKSARIKKMCKGYFRGIEVTYNEEEDTYHPHIHTIIAVNPSYFTSRDYIKQKEWGYIWQKYLKTDYTPRVDVRKFEDNSYKAVAEVSKYTVKSKDMFKYNLDGTINEELTDKIIFNLHMGLRAKRLVGMGGIFKEYHKKLNLEDLNKDDIDLVNTDNQEEDDTLNDIIYRYNWYCGFKNYFLVKN